ncbi:MAG: archaellin/type IV pilin N-terminal domain-containing protein [Haloferacaceae archaeon]
MIGREDRAVSPAIATVLLVALVILLASLLMVGLGDFSLPDPEYRSRTTEGRGVIIALGDDPDATSARHKVVVPIREGTSLDGDSLNSVKVDYLDDSADISEVSRADVRTVGIDEDGDGSIDTNVSDDLSTVDGREGGDLLYIGFGGSYGITKGDQVIVVFDDVGNPPAGVYPASVYLNDYRTLARLGTIDIESRR